jgi:hypothetical protein
MSMLGLPVLHPALHCLQAQAAATSRTVHGIGTYIIVVRAHTTSLIRLAALCCTAVVCLCPQM